MSLAESPWLADPSTRTTAARWRGSAFGLALDAAFVLPGIVAGTSNATVGASSVERVSPTELERTWPSREASPILDRRHRDGSLMMAIDGHPQLGYRIWAPRHGRHIVSPDGSGVRSALPKVVPWRWQRLLYAQVLPLAATLQGIELFHASAIELEGRALGFIAPSGTGKTTVAVHLVAQGASFLTDDVLALMPAGDAVLAYSGGGLVNVPADEWKLVPRSARGRVGVVVGRSDKIHLAPSLVTDPRPLDRLYFLARGTRFRKLAFRPCEPPNPALLLSSGFISYVRTFDRLTNQLDVCAAVAARVPTVEVDVPAGYRAADVAAAVLAHEEGRR